MKYCRQCGKKIESNDLFCGRCGTNVLLPENIIEKSDGYSIDEKNAETTEADVITEVNHGIKSIIIGVTIGLFFLAVIGLTIIWNMTRPLTEEEVTSGTYGVSYIDADGNIEHNAFWLSTDKTKVLDLVRYDSYNDDEDDYCYGGLLDKSGCRKKFLWSINDQNELIITEKVIYLTGEDTVYSFSDDVGANTWYYDREAKTLRIGTDEYLPVSEEEVDEIDIDNNDFVDRREIVDIRLTSIDVVKNCLFDETYRSDSCSFWKPANTEDGNVDYVLTFRQTEGEGIGGSLYSSGYRNMFIWGINEQQELTVDYNIIYQKPTAKKVYAFSKDNSESTWYYDFENNTLRIGKQQYLSVFQKDVNEIDEDSNGYYESKEISGIEIVDCSLIKNCLFDETFESDSHSFWVSDDEDLIIYFYYNNSASDNENQTPGIFDFAGNYRQSDEENEYRKGLLSMEISDDYTLSIKRYVSGSPQKNKFTFSSEESGDTWYYDFDTHQLRIGKEKFHAVRDSEYRKINDNDIEIAGYVFHLD